MERLTRVGCESAAVIQALHAADPNWAITYGAEVEAHHPDREAPNPIEVADTQIRNSIAPVLPLPPLPFVVPRRSGVRALPTSVVGLVVVVLGVFMARHVLWFAVPVAVACLYPVVLNVVDRRPSVVADADGFTTRRLVRTQRVNWAEVASFGSVTKRGRGIYDARLERLPFESEFLARLVAFLFGTRCFAILLKAGRGVVVPDPVPEMDLEVARTALVEIWTAFLARHPQAETRAR